MTTLEALERWRAEGAISDRQHAALTALASGRRMSVFLELNAVLYIGVLAIVGGLAWTIRTYAAAWGDAAVIAPGLLCMLGAFAYCVARSDPYTPARAPARSFVLDYVLYFACLVFAIELAFVEYRFELLRARWHAYLLASAMLYLHAARDGGQHEGVPGRWSRPVGPHRGGRDHDGGCGWSQALACRG